MADFLHFLWGSPENKAISWVLYAITSRVRFEISCYVLVNSFSLVPNYVLYFSILTTNIIYINFIYICKIKAASGTPWTPHPSVNSTLPAPLSIDSWNDGLLFYRYAQFKFFFILSSKCMYTNSVFCSV